MTSLEQQIPTLEETLLQQVLAEFKKQAESLQQVLTENQLIKEDLKKTKIDLLALAEGSEKTFDKIGSILSELQKNKTTDVGTTPATPSQGGGIGGTLGQILQSIMDTINKAPQAASQTNDFVTQELTTMLRDNFKTQLQIMKLTSQATLKTAAKAAGVAVPEITEHITVGP